MEKKKTLLRIERYYFIIIHFVVYMPAAAIPVHYCLRVALKCRTLNKC